VVELDAAAAQIQLPLALFDELRGERGLGPAPFRPEKLLEVPAQEVAADIGRKAEEPRLALGIAVALQDRQPVCVDQIERIPAVISRSSRTAEPPPDESPPRE